MYCTRCTAICTTLGVLCYVLHSMFWTMYCVMYCIPVAKAQPGQRPMPAGVLLSCATVPPMPPHYPVTVPPISVTVPSVSRRSPDQLSLVPTSRQCPATALLLTSRQSMSCSLTASLRLVCANWRLWCVYSLLLIGSVLTAYCPIGAYCLTGVYCLWCVLTVHCPPRCVSRC